ncbi:hypothetical protein LTR72_009481 [Exophiala xenobiotica]|nr:hypothetical protein LTR72_009481 [Exophiala xenobiotica]KAK5314246.1 hypothetical protein LTR93_010525 [Exophiala xenobiotica]KAK5494683.1 hypothetical protein LTR55_003070 [Exophiala xenobiotica]
MDFVVPQNMPPIATYRIMNSEGVIEDESHKPEGVTNEQVVGWYKGMLTDGALQSVSWTRSCPKPRDKDDSVSTWLVPEGTTGSVSEALTRCQVSTGEEGITIGSAAALGPDDIITCQYRETGVFQQRGFTLKDFMSQLMHNKNDPGKGRNMPVHYSGRVKTGVHAVASTLGTQIPHATGAAYAMKLEDQETGNKSPRVAAAYFGDGAASEGDFHGALNLAATRDCPVIFICRNNGFAISTPTAEQYRGDGIASRGIGYGIESLRVDGTDIFAVYKATKEARRRALENGGRPILLEFMSYRISHHSTSDDSFAYRTHDEVNPWKTRDNPIARLRRWLERNELWNEDLEKKTRAEIRRDILTEMKAAEKEQKPSLTSIWDDVYAEYSEEQLAQREEMKRLMLKYPEEYDVDNYEGGVQAL